MHKIYRLTILAVLTLGFTACNKQEEKKAVETPAALKDEKVDIKSYSRSNDLVNELYTELVEQSPELKRLEDNLKAYYGKPNEMHQLFEKYNEKSNSYYSSAEYEATAITDSLLKRKMNQMLANSKAKYEKKAAEHNTLLKTIDKKDVSIHDQHSALKIMLTLAIIEKFQNENLPSKSEFRNMIKKQALLLQQIDSITPKN